MLVGFPRNESLKSIFLFVLLSFFSGLSFAIDDSLKSRFSAAQALADEGQLTEAIAAYQSLIKTHPQFPEAYNNLAAIYLKQKKTNQAKNILEQGLHAHKGYAALYDNLSAINVAMAREAYSKALQLDLKPSSVSIAAISLNKDKNAAAINTSAKKVEAKVIEENIAEAQEKLLANKNVNNIKPIEIVLQEWAAAWSAQAVDVYLSFYHQQYKPVNGMSRNNWVQSRRYRLKKPKWIKVALADINLVKITDKQALVNFKQSYQSNSFDDTGSKQMVLLYTEKGWRIFREKNI